MTPTPRHTLVFEAADLQELRRFFSDQAPLETAAFVLARPAQTPQGSWRLIVSEVIQVDAANYDRRTPVAIDLPPAVIAEVLARARREQLSVILAHSHPGTLGVQPSKQDLDGEARLRPTLHRRVPGVPHGRLILSENDAHAALFLADGSTPLLKVIGVGPDITAFTGYGASLDDRYDRQVRAFGADGQHLLSTLRVGIVGLGGTGSVVTQQLAHLGVGAFQLIDPDVIETTNLNRVVGALPIHAFAAAKKVDVAADVIRSINPAAAVTTSGGDIRDEATARSLLDCDFFFACTDSHGSRAVLTQLAYQYRLPGIDMGVAVHAREGAVTHVAGRVQMLASGLACLSCSAVLDPEEVRRDLLTDDERRADPYIVGEAVPQPAVISINSATASLAVTMMLSALTGMPFEGRHLRLRLETGLVKPVHVEPNPRCPICSKRGANGQGDRWPAPGRQEKVKEAVQ